MDFKKEMTNLSKKITLMMDLQRTRFSDFEVTLAKMNVRMDALSKKQVTLSKQTSKSIIQRKQSS